MHTVGSSAPFSCPAARTQQSFLEKLNVSKEKGEGSSRNMYKGHMDKAKGGQDQGWKVGMGGVGEEWWGGGKWRQLYLNNFFKKRKKINKKLC